MTGQDHALGNGYLDVNGKTTFALEDLWHWLMTLIPYQAHGVRAEGRSVCYPTQLEQRRALFMEYVAPLDAHSCRRYSDTLKQTINMRQTAC